jgi:hypothetical protein
MAAAEAAQASNGIVRVPRISGGRALLGRSPIRNGASVRPRQVKRAPRPRSFVKFGNKFTPKIKTMPRQIVTAVIQPCQFTRTNKAIRRAQSCLPYGTQGQDFVIGIVTD